MVSNKNVRKASAFFSRFHLKLLKYVLCCLENITKTAKQLFCVYEGLIQNLRISCAFVILVCVTTRHIFQKITILLHDKTCVYCCYRTEKLKHTWAIKQKYKFITARIRAAKNVYIDAVISIFRRKCCLFNCRRTRLCLPVTLKWKLSSTRKLKPFKDRC